MTNSNSLLAQNITDSTTTFASTSCLANTVYSLVLVTSTQLYCVPLHSCEDSGVRTVSVGYKEKMHNPHMSCNK